MPNTTPPASSLTDRYDYTTRRDLIQQPIVDHLLLQDQNLICRLDIRLDAANRKHRSSTSESPPPSAFLSAYRDLHSYLFKTLDEMIFKTPANQIPHHQRTLGYSFAEDLSAHDKTPRPLHYHCLIFSDDQRTHAAMQDPFFRLKLISKIQRYLTRRLQDSHESSNLHRTPIKQSFTHAFRFRLSNSTPEHRHQLISYATKFIDDTYLKNRHHQTFAVRQQNYADDSRLDQMIISTDFLSSTTPEEVKRIRDQKRNRSRRQRITTREQRINSLHELDGRRK